MHFADDVFDDASDSDDEHEKPVEKHIDEDESERIIDLADPAEITVAKHAEKVAPSSSTGPTSDAHINEAASRDPIWLAAQRYKMKEFEETKMVLSKHATSASTSTAQQPKVGFFFMYVRVRVRVCVFRNTLSAGGLNSSSIVDPGCDRDLAGSGRARRTEGQAEARGHHRQPGFVGYHAHAGAHDFACMQLCGRPS